MSNQLLLSKQTWQFFGISHRELLDMDPYDIEMLKLVLVTNG